MIPAEHEHANLVVKGIPEAHVDDLTVACFVTPEGVLMRESCWMLSLDEIETVMKEGVVYLTVIGPGPHPVVSLNAAPLIRCGASEDQDG